MRKSKILAALAGTVALATALSSCGSSSPGASGGTASTFNAGLNSVVNASTHQGGTLRFGMASDWDSPDPGNTYYTFSWNFLRLYGRALLTYAQKPGGDGLKLVPDLATDTGTKSADGLTWTYTLRPGATYQDGTPITAQDVKYAVERSNWGQDTLTNGPNYFYQYIQDTTHYKGPYLDKNPKDGVSGIEVVGTDTIKFHLTQKFAEFPYMAALPDTVPVPAAKDTGAHYGTSLVASGQYEIQDYTPGKSMTLVPNPKFNPASDPDGLHKVTAAKITVQLNMNQDQLDQELMHGQIDADLGGTGVGTTAQAQILASPTLKANADDGYTGALTYLTFNFQVAPFDNVDCRKAVEYAIDKTAVQSALGGSIGGGDIATTVLPPNVTGYAQANAYETAGNQGDVVQAKTELATCRAAEPNAFTGDGFTADISARVERPKEINSALAIAASLKQVGINAQVVKFTGAKYFSDFAGNASYAKTNKIGMSMMKWLFDWPDGYGDLDQIVTPAGIHAGGGSVNIGNYSDPAVNSLFTRALATEDDTARANLWTDVDRAVMGDAAVVPLIYNKALNYHPANVTNWFFDSPFGQPDFAVLGTTATS